LIIITLLCGVEIRAQNSRTADRYFTQDVFFFKPDTGDSIRTDVFVAVPFGNLSFLNAGDRYVADYGVIVQVMDAQTDALILDRYQEHTVTESFGMREKRMEIDQERANATQYSFKLLPQQSYDIRISVRDLNANVTADTTINLKSPDFSRGVTLSSPLLYRSRKGSQILPLIGSDVSTLSKDEAGFFVELYGASGGKYLLAQYTYARSDENEAISPIFTSVKSDGSARQPLFQSFDPSELWMGEYNVDLFLLPTGFDTSNVTLSSLRKNAIASTTRSIRTPVQSGIPFAESDLDKAIEQVNIIATIWEWDSLTMGKNRKEKRQNLIEFWRKRDPNPWDKANPVMEVFYKRLAYANFHFAGMGNEGWRTDRGRVYIVLGEPTYVDRSPYQATSKPYEVWEYSDLNVRYYFVDHYLLGDYRLTSPPPRQGVFLWDRGAF
jgi:GWxTD domain-containing protein